MEKNHIKRLRLRKDVKPGLSRLLTHLISCSPVGVKEIDIAATLEHIRDQRPGMVRTKVTCS